MEKKLIEIASEIVKTQVAMSPMSGNEIATSLREVFKTLQEMQKSEVGGIDIEEQAANESPQESKAGPDITPANSIQNDKVICLECGKEMRQLTARHLSSHGLTPREYRHKYGFTMRTPLSAKSLTRVRSKIAKKRGLPANLTKFLEERRQNKLVAQDTPPEADGKQAEQKSNQIRLRKRTR
ncbi:MAG: MucR family transcriptional regulator [Syntrophobacter sp.]